MNGPRLMTDEELPRVIDFLEYFGVCTNVDYVYLTSGGNSCIMNMNTEWKEFLGCSVNSVSEAYARKVNKPTKWVD